MRMKNKPLKSNFKTMQNTPGTTKTKEKRWLIVQKVVIIRFNCESVFSHLRLGGQNLSAFSAQSEGKSYHQHCVGCQRMGKKFLECRCSLCEK